MPHLAFPDLLLESTFPHGPYGCKMQWVKKYFILLEWTGRHCSTERTSSWLDKCGGSYLNLVKLPLNHGASSSRLRA